MVAVAIYAILGGRPLLEEEKQQKNDISLTWFIYQSSLSEGCNRLAAVVSELPVSLQTAELLVDLLLRMDKKLCTGGVDDSDGVVGGCMEEIVGVLEEFSKADSRCIVVFCKLFEIETCFGWEKPLVAIAKRART